MSWNSAFDNPPVAAMDRGALNLTRDDDFYTPRLTKSDRISHACHGLFDTVGMAGELKGISRRKTDLVGISG